MTLEKTSNIKYKEKGKEIFKSLTKAFQKSH